MNNNPFGSTVSSVKELRDILGYPGELVKRKTIDHIDDHCTDFISKSPFLLISSSDQNGFCDVSPRGDAPGFVHVIDEKHLLIPDRPGNRRVDSIENIITNPHIGILFLIPGLGETLRVNGKAYVVNDPNLLEVTEVKGKVPLLGIGIEVEECFIHCAKSLIRSDLWNTDSWLASEELPSPAKILTDHVKSSKIREKEMEEMLEGSYKHELY
ncbi:pyridoxamine 5'-phosphate oxidase family protein [Salipaludibacillus sp. HK11]|uniref:pyridoxamine 5'-phosphate oxidase family protein n=1 Tax=Salipaludibacillus sp. HK11 TaxID=3394320 RepID=UPI0039FD2E6D